MAVVLKRTTKHSMLSVSLFRLFCFDRLQWLNTYAFGNETGNAMAYKYAEKADMSDPDYDFTRLMTDELNDVFFYCPNRALLR